jgi:bifunctional non-homologous end joining protein LigD
VVSAGGATRRAALDRRLAAGHDEGIIYFVFDLVEQDGRDLGPRPLEERKAALRALVKGCGGELCYVEHVVGRGHEFLAAACGRGVGGIVSKKRAARYRPGAGRAWLAVTCDDRTAAGREPSRRGRAAPREPGVEVLGVPISHPDRLMFPELGVTKLDLARYAADVARWWLPHVAGRPLTVVRCERGVRPGGEGCVFMRHGRAWGPAALRRVSIREKRKTGEYLVADTPAALVALVQMDIVEVHTWNTRADDVERPDRVVIDLDPGDRVEWAEVVRAARAVRDALEALGLASWVKTTGGRGLHVVAPLVPERDWTECLAFARGFAAALERQRPDVFTTRFARAGRERRILIDYLRNNRTNTSVAALSPRARPDAPVSMPLTWRELSPSTPGDHHTVASAPRRLVRLAADPWADYFRARQRLSASMLRAVT